MLIKREDRTEDSVKSNPQDEKQRVYEHLNLQNDGIFSHFLSRGHTSSPGRELRHLGDNQGGNRKEGSVESRGE